MDYGPNYNGHDDLSTIIDEQYNGSRKGMSLWEYAETHEDNDTDWDDEDD